MESWRLVDSGPCNAYHNMALDEAMAEFVRKGSSPVLRFYGWKMPAVSLGGLQKSSDIDLEYCRAETVPVVRRPTGGRAIFHNLELTYSFSAGTDTGPFQKGLLDSYRRIGVAFRLAFSKLGIEADCKPRREKGSILAGNPLCFGSSSFGEILVRGRKVIGSAQKRWNNGLLQQGSIPYFSDEEDVCRIAGTRAGGTIGNSMTGLKELAPGLDEALLKDAVAASFEEAFRIRLVHRLPTPGELSLAQELEAQKYRCPDWTLRR